MLMSMEVSEYTPLLYITKGPLYVTIQGDSGHNCFALAVKCLDKVSLFFFIKTSVSAWDSIIFNFSNTHITWSLSLW